MAESTAPYNACIGCMHLGSKRAIDSVATSGLKPVCNLRAGQRFTSDCAFSPMAHQTRIDELYRMPSVMRTRIGCEG